MEYLTIRIPVPARRGRRLAQALAACLLAASMAAQNGPALCAEAPAPPEAQEGDAAQESMGQEVWTEAPAAQEAAADAMQEGGPEEAAEEAAEKAAAEAAAVCGPAFPGGWLPSAGAGRDGGGLPKAGAGNGIASADSGGMPTAVTEEAQDGAEEGGGDAGSALLSSRGQESPAAIEGASQEPPETPAQAVPAPGAPEAAGEAGPEEGTATEDMEAPAGTDALIMGLCSEKAAPYGLSPYLLYALLERESRLQPGASGGGNIGIAQVNPRWHGERMARLGATDLTDPGQCILVCADYLAEMFALGIEKGYGPDPYFALMAYNMGPEGADAPYRAGRISGYARGICDRAAELEALADGRGEGPEEGTGEEKEGGTEDAA